MIKLISERKKVMALASRESGINKDPVSGHHPPSCGKKIRGGIKGKEKRVRNNGTFLSV